MPFPSFRFLLGCIALLGAAAIGLSPRAHADPIDAHRVWVRYIDGRFVTLALDEIRAVVPPSDALATGTTALSGFWVELRTAAGDLRYRRILGDPIRLFFEGRNLGAPAAPTTLDRDEAIPQSRLFTLLLPRAAASDELVLFASPLVGGFDEQPASEIGRLRLDTGSAP